MTDMILPCTKVLMTDIYLCLTVYTIDAHTFKEWHAHISDFCIAQSQPL